MKNPLNKRIPRELLRDWRKYFVIIVFMTFMIGVVSAMYIGHDSMLAAIDDTQRTSRLEDGRFETDEALSEKEIGEIETGEMADVRGYFISKGREEAEEEIEKEAAEELEDEVRDGIESAARAQCAAFGITDESVISGQIETAISANYDDALAEARRSEEYKEALEDAKEEAFEEVEKEVDEEWDRIADRYDLEAEGFTPTAVEISPHFFREEDENQDYDGSGDAVIRVFKSDSDVDLATFNEGRAPENENEIAIDRMHADNVGLAVGDVISLGERRFEIVGLLSYVNYTTLHEKNTDLMFDAFGFDVGMVTPEAFELLESKLHYNYVFMYCDEPADETAEADAAENFLKALVTRLAVAEFSLEDYVPEYANQSSHFAPSDIDGDTAGAEVLIYILIAVIAFIFAVTISTTIDIDASVIGTLRASGYTRGEMTRHYMAMPLLITLIGALIGNIMGYTVFKDLVVYLYYNSYSLPGYTTVWSPDAFIRTTLIPLLLMLLINLFVIRKKLRLSPLRFLRHDLKKTRRTKAVRLPSWRFMRRFRIRVLLQNIPNYLILIFGIIFIEIMLCFAFGFPDSLDHYAETAPDMMFAPYQYMLTDSEDEDGDELTTDTEGAEKFGAINLEQARAKQGKPLRGASGSGESVTVYGYQKESSYIEISSAPAEGSVYVSSAYADKYRLSPGDSITLSEKYENTSYTFEVGGIFRYDGGIAAFMPIDQFNRAFDRNEGDFSGYFSSVSLTDIDEKYIANIMTAEDVVKISNQLQHSMGGFMKIFRYALLIMSAALIYLLSKIIIEKNESSISMAKILGFRNSEISSLYMLPTALVVLIFAFAGFFIGRAVITVAFRAFLMQMDGWFTFWMSSRGMAGTILFVLIGYAAVSAADYRRITRIPLEKALKDIE